MANGGMLGGLSNLFNNPAFLQALFGAGMAINKGEEVVPSLAAGAMGYYNQQQAAEANAALIRQILAAQQVMPGMMSAAGNQMAAGNVPINTGGFAPPAGPVLGNPVQTIVKWENPDTGQTSEFKTTDKRENTESFGTNIRPEEIPATAKPYEAIQSPSDMASKMLLGGNLGNVLAGR